MQMTSRKLAYRRWLVRIFVVMVAAAIGYIWYFYDSKIPDSMSISSQEDEPFAMNMPYLTSMESDAAEVSVSANRIQSEVLGTYEIEVKLLGIVPLKTVEVNVVERDVVYLGGEPIGLYLQTDGVMIIDTGEVTDANGQITDPASELVRAGDYIVKINNVPVSSKDQLVFLVQKYGSEPIQMQTRRGSKLIDLQITPSRQSDGTYKLGIWVRDDTQGIGTLTYTRQDGTFGALGHGISDVDTSKLLTCNGGTLYKADIWGIVKGEEGEPGGLCGMIHYEEANELGSILKNSDCGIYGTCNELMRSEYQSQTIEVGYKQEIVTGAAQIYTNVDGEAQYYDINILEISYNENWGNKGLIIEVTDPELLKLTGGIIQGMSGSPIIQNGKLVGAVTHVFVDDPTRGYGIFIEEMLSSD